MTDTSMIGWVVRSPFSAPTPEPATINSNMTTDAQLIQHDLAAASAVESQSAVVAVVHPLLLPPSGEAIMSEGGHKADCSADEEDVDDGGEGVEKDVEDMDGTGCQPLASTNPGHASRKITIVDNSRASNCAVKQDSLSEEVRCPLLN